MGLDYCAGGQFRRRAVVECPTNFPDPNACCGGCPDGQICDGEKINGCSCLDACTNDSECGPGKLCMCGGVAGICVSAKCATGSDCAAGQECTSWDSSQGCKFFEFACTTPADACGGDNDCNETANHYCSVQPDGHRQCMPDMCVIGRPFLVAGEARTAPLAPRSDWAKEGISPRLEGLDEVLASELATAWEDTARMEHASIAAFARFSLQLLALGAPPDLVERTNRAMIDETQHARAAFALASAYRGRRLGPGPLPSDGTLDGGNDVETIVRLVIREGCVGETVAALEAGEAEARAMDPVVRSILGEIAADESEHAELAWRTVRWALSTFGDVIRALVREEIALLSSERRSSRGAAPSPRDEALLLHGVVSGELRASMRHEAIRRAILPCLDALLEETLPLAA